MLQKLVKLTIPRSPSKPKSYRRILPEHEPVLFVDLYRYCIQDIRAESALSEATPDLSDFELRVWQLDQRINSRGVQVDLESLEACIRVVEATERKYAARLCEVLGDPTVTVDQVERLRVWCGEQGTPMESFAKQSVEDALGSFPSPEVREVLEIRQALGAKAIKKLYTLRATTGADGRVRGLFAYCGAAATGRWAGRGAQPQNFPNHGPAIKRVDEALGDFKEVNLTGIEAKYGSALKTVGSTLRGLFIAAPGKVLVGADFSAIEAIVLSELAEESWMQEEFRKPKPAIYEATGAMVTGTSLSEILAYRERTGEHHPDRKLGKTASLASGYQGAVGAWRKFGADSFMSDEDLLRAVKAWRKRCPKIVSMWYGCEKAAKAAILSRGEDFRYKFITYQVRDNVLYAKLPSGRELTYHNPRMAEGTFGLQVSFDGWNSDSTKGPVGWCRRYTYGGSLVENFTQATARDILANSMLNLEQLGYDIVLHVHDEVVSEVPQGFGSVSEFETIMSIMPTWAAKWPIRATDGWVGHRYRKG